MRALWSWLFGRPFLLLVLTTLMWGGNAVASRLAVGHISPMALTCLRWLGVCAILAPLMGRQVVADLPVLLPRWSYIALMAALGFTVFNALMYAAAHHTSAVNLTILQGSVPVLVLLGSLVWFGTRIRLVQILGMAVTLIGVATVAARGEFETLATLAFNIGDVWMMFACAAYAGYTVALRKRPQVSGFVFFAAMAAVAFALTIPLLAWEVARGTVIWPDARGWAILLYVTLFPSLLSQIFYMRGVELIGPGRAGLFVNLVPVFGAMLAVALLGEPFRLYHALSLGLVLAGIWLAERNR
ncbi:MAG TPA: DMT family transporter [Beijerinckiaceae bacterium]|nr:DMT family transporter [Beijerinckiaceae bacterium]